MYIQHIQTPCSGVKVSKLLQHKSLAIIGSLIVQETVVVHWYIKYLTQLYMYYVRHKPEAAGPEEYGIPANTLDPSISWKDVYWLQSITRLPIIIKGILTKEDAELAVEHGVQGIIVSNHGGRQLDGGPATVLIVHIHHTSILFLVSRL